MIITLHRVEKGERVEKILPNVASIKIGSFDCFATFRDGTTMAISKAELVSVETQTETVVMKD